MGSQYPSMDGRILNLQVFTTSVAKYFKRQILKESSVIFNPLSKQKSSLSCFLRLCKRFADSYCFLMVSLLTLSCCFSLVKCMFNSWLINISQKNLLTFHIFTSKQIAILDLFYQITLNVLLCNICFSHFRWQHVYWIFYLVFWLHSIHTDII